MALNSTSTQRTLWAPACRANVRQGVFDAWKALNWILRLFNYAPRQGVTGARSCRKITGGTGWSLHAFYVDGFFVFWNGLKIGLGIAVDINWDRNPYGRRLVTDMPRDMVEAILAIRTNNGEEVWGWGGNYSRNKDAMHWELGCSPRDLATGIDWSTVRSFQAETPTPPPGVEADRKWPGNPSAKFGAYNTTEFSGRYDGNVEYIQKLLNRTNLDLKVLLNDPRVESKLRIDGFYGSNTERAVRGFQGAQKLAVDGMVGPMTWAKLNEVT